MPNNSTNLAFAFDLTLDEVRRRSAVLDALGADWDPILALEEEEQAYAMLYANLDAEQQRHYDALVLAGVLPERAVNRASD
jgi:2-hydroxychromene-2-carboxylate isomerase